MKKFLFTIAVIFTVAAAIGAENLLLNSNFSEMTPLKLPTYWQIRELTAGNLAVKDGIFTVTTKGKGGILVQNGLKLQANKDYKLSYEYNAAPNSQFRLYTEWATAIDGKRQWHSSGTNWLKGDGKWHLRELVFPANFTRQEQFAFAHCALAVKEKSSVQIRNLKLVEYVKPLAENLDFSAMENGIPVIWELRGKRENFSFDGNCVTFNAPVMMVHHKLFLQAGKKYVLSFEVKGDAGFRGYFECAYNPPGQKRKWESFNTGYFVPGKEWVKKSITFTNPENLAFSHIVFQSNTPGAVSIRNIQITVKDDVALFGGKFTGADVKALPGSEVELCSSSKGEVRLVGWKLKPDQYYRLSCNVLGVGSAGNITDMHPFQFEVRFADVEHRIMSDTFDVGNIQRQNKEFFFRTPANTGGEVILAFRIHTQGAVRFKDLKIEEAVPEKESPAFVLTSPVYRNTIFSSVSCREISGYFINTDTPCRGKVTLSKDGNIIADGVVKNVGGKNCFDIKINDLPDGIYQLSAELTDGKKHIIIKDTVSKLPPAKQEVTLDGRGNLLINGKYFPVILFWNIPHDEKCLKYAAANGVTAFCTHSGNREDHAFEILEKARKSGLKVFLSLFLPASDRKEDLDNFAQTLYAIMSKRVLEHPALLGWFYTDEPAWAGVPLKRLHAGYEIIRRIDPYHPVWLNEAPRGLVDLHTKVSRSSDIYGIDIYPVPYPNAHSALEDKGMTSVGKYTAICRQAVTPGKGVFMALQGMSWQALDGSDNGKNYPTGNELRFMIFDSLFNGSNGISFWGTQYIKTPEFYDTLFAVCKETYAVLPLFSCGKFTGGSKADNAAIRTRTIIYNDHTYVIAVNYSGKTVAANIQVPFKNGTVTGTFAPWEVQIHTDGKLQGFSELPVYNGKSPYPDHIYRLTHKNYYTGKANWIWDGKQFANLSKASLYRSITLTKMPVSAEMLAVADDIAFVSVNGSKAIEVRGWTPLKRINLLPYLKAGENKIVFNGEDMGILPCGILAEITIKYADGSKETILTDDKWLTAGGDKVKIVAPYGGGAWGAKVEMPLK